jgi:hypothetical protein
VIHNPFDQAGDVGRLPRPDTEVGQRQLEASPQHKPGHNSGAGRAGGNWGLWDVLADMAQHPDGLDLLEQCGTAFLGALWRAGFGDAMDRFLAKGIRLPTANKAVGLTAVQLVERDPARIQLLVCNLGAATIYLGDTKQVTVGGIAGGGGADPLGGYPLLTNAQLILDRMTSEVWAISGTATQDVRVLDLSG